MATLVAGLAACGSKAKSARDYNNNIIAQEKILEPDAIATENNVKKYYAAAQYDSIAVAGEKMESLIQKSIDEINTLPAPDAKGVDSFKAAMIRYFSFVKSIFTNYKEYGQAGTDEKRQEVFLNIQNTASQRQDHLNDLQSAQRKFAEANNFKLERKTY